jgi:hypothetical protein
MFVVIVFRQARERELDQRSVIISLAIVAYVAHLYVRSIPTAGNDPQGEPVRAERSELRSSPLDAGGRPELAAMWVLCQREMLQTGTLPADLP